MPGHYTITLSVGGKSYSQPLILQMDPRVKTSTNDLAEQFRVSKLIYDQWLALAAIAESARPVRGQIVELRSRIPEDLKPRFDEFSEKLQVFGGGGGGFGAGGPGAAGARLTVAGVTGRLRTLFNEAEGVDLAPTAHVKAAADDVIKDARSLQENWQAIRLQALPALNQELQGKGLPLIAVPK
ncbi:MAG TPA: hypothetical protein VGU64_21660, partial [Terriglobales bacterium]|nr:hypothetical protein [Terriglobales bacterium]